MKRGWGDLPSELLLLIMSYMEAKDLARLADVNYHWRRVSEDDTLWKPLLIRDYELPKSTKIKVWFASPFFLALLFSSM